jgi:hypothetical protein
MRRILFFGINPIAPPRAAARIIALVPSCELARRRFAPSCSHSTRHARLLRGLPLHVSGPAPQPIHRRKHLWLRSHEILLLIQERFRCPHAYIRMPQRGKNVPARHGTNATPATHALIVTCKVRAGQVKDSAKLPICDERVRKKGIHGLAQIDCVRKNSYWARAGSRARSVKSERAPQSSRLRRFAGHPLRTLASGNFRARTGFLTC